MSAVGIIGWGVVGKATGKGFGKGGKNKIFWWDKFVKGPHSLDDVIEKSDFTLVCVPTPMFADGSGIDLSVVNEVVRKVAPKLSGTKKVLVIKSSVVPGTTAKYARRYPKVKFAMVPEFLTEINAEWDFLHTDRVIIGAFDEGVGVEIAKLHRTVMAHKIKIFITDPTSAEMAKYMANTFMAVKTIFGNEMKELADRLKINYDDVREMVSADKRINPSFLKATPFGGFGRKCFPKDTVALLGLSHKMKVDLSVLEAAWTKNLKVRKIYDWEDIEGAVNSRKKVEVIDRDNSSLYN